MISELTDDNLGLERCCSLWFWVELLPYETIFESFITSPHYPKHNFTLSVKSFLTSKTDTQSARLDGVRLKRVNFTIFSSGKYNLLKTSSAVF